MIAIGGGGYVPARILRYVSPGPNRTLRENPRSNILVLHSSFLKRTGDPNIPIQAIGLSLYEDLGRGDPEEVPGTKVTRTQWLDLSSLEMANLIGKNILIVDEVDDTRTTLEYAVRELEKDVEQAQKQLGRESEKTNFFIFVLHVRSSWTSQVLRFDADICFRTRTRRRRVFCRPAWWRAVVTTPPSPPTTCGFATLGRPSMFHRWISIGSGFLKLTLSRDIDEHDALAKENPLV